MCARLKEERETAPLHLLRSNSLYYISNKVDRLEEDGEREMVEKRGGFSGSGDGSPLFSNGIFVVREEGRPNRRSASYPRSSSNHTKEALLFPPTISDHTSLRQLFHIFQIGMIVLNRHAAPETWLR